MGLLADRPNCGVLAHRGRMKRENYYISSI